MLHFGRGRVRVLFLNFVVVLVVVVAAGDDPARPNEQAMELSSLARMRQ
jgi:hypothetical protein